MIIGQKKPVEELWSMIKFHKRIHILGCNTCVAVCHEGGTREADTIASLLRIKAKQENTDIEITSSGIERQCEHEFFDKFKEGIDKYDALLSTACGIGVQFSAEIFSDLPVFPGLDTVFLGAAEQSGLWTERCQACGHCILGQTAGVCPISRCAKRIMNGPCGGSTGGKCEINKDIDCAWQLIINRLSSLGQLDLYETLTPLKDWSTDRAGGPRQLFKEDMS